MLVFRKFCVRTKWMIRNTASKTISESLIPYMTSASLRSYMIFLKVKDIQKPNFITISRFSLFIFASLTDSVSNFEI